MAGDGATRAVVSAQLPSGLIINDVRLMRAPNGYWIAMPAVKMIDRDGKPLLGANKKPLYKQIVEFKDRATRDRFSAMVLEAARRSHPEAFDGEGEQ